MFRAFLVFAFLTGCSDFPEIGKAEARLGASGVTPGLLTAEEIAALTASAPDPGAGLAAEAADLRSRAKTLRQR